MRRDIEIVSFFRDVLRLRVNRREMVFRRVLEPEETEYERRWVLVSPLVSNFYADSDILSFLMEFSEPEQRRILSMMNMSFQIS